MKVKKSYIGWRGNFIYYLIYEILSAIRYYAELRGENASFGDRAMGRNRQTAKAFFILRFSQLIAQFTSINSLNTIAKIIIHMKK